MVGRFKETHTQPYAIYVTYCIIKVPILILLGSNYESSQGHQQVSEFIAQVSLLAAIHVFL